MDLEVYTVRWFFSMWCIDLPLDYALTILDLFQIDLQTTLVRISLSIFLILAPEIKLARDQE